MTDKENVIKGLKCHMADPDGSLDCIECPYSQRSGTYIDNSAGCLNRLHADALALLKEQDAIIEQYHKADTFLEAHGWKWEGR